MTRESKRPEPDGYWTKHYQSAYLEDAANPNLPNAIRVAFLAYGRHKANGHARFKQMELRNILGEFDSHGTFEPATKYAVERAIARAVSYGLLGEGSKTLCLVVPGHRIHGHQGDWEAPCDRHPASKNARRARTLRAVS